MTTQEFIYRMSRKLRKFTGIEFDDMEIRVSPTKFREICDEVSGITDTVLETVETIHGIPLIVDREAPDNEIYIRQKGA